MFPSANNIYSSFNSVGMEGAESPFVRKTQIGTKYPMQTTLKKSQTKLKKNATGNSEAARKRKKLKDHPSENCGTNYESLFEGLEGWLHADNVAMKIVWI